MKTQTKKKKFFNKNSVFIIIIIFLIITNIYYIISYKNINKEEKIIEEVLFVENNGEYKENKKYYAKINYSKFKSLYKKNNVSTIAIIDNSSKTYNKFIELINKTAFYKNTKIYLFEISKLSRKNEIAFYNLDDRLKSLETNYIIVVSNNKILSITTFENSEINKLIESLGD